MTNNRVDTRKLFALTWKKFCDSEVLSPLENQITSVIQLHPEYHSYLDDVNNCIDTDFSTDNNPFLHMGLHLGVREQVSTNRPAGISDIHNALRQKSDVHQAEHLMMDVLGNFLWDAQQSGQLPDESMYLEKLKQLACI
jgi:hypothetical protein